MPAAGEREPIGYRCSTLAERGPGCRARTFLGPLVALFVCFQQSDAPLGAEMRPDPEAASGIIERTAVAANRYMIAASHPLAAEAGLEALRRGGSAVDAAIAAQMVLTLVEPQSSGIGGGGFLLHYDAESGELKAYDGRETAPAAATPDMFLDESGEPLAFFDAVVGGLSVGVPGLVPMLERAHREEGELPWASLFAEAIALAERGFPVSPRLHALIAADKYLKRHPATAAYFHTPEGAPLPAGHILRNPELADTLRALAEEGSAAILTGEIAAEIVAEVRGFAANPGRLSMQDLAGYQPVVREAVCRAYRHYRACGMPPPSAGPIAVLQTLGMLERFDVAARGPWSVESAHLFAEASRLAFADRTYVADPAFVDVPVGGLLDQRYLLERSERICMDGSLGEVLPGTPAIRKTELAPPADGMIRPPSTMHLSVVDEQGNVASLTSSVENAFGSRIMVRGFMLNNQLTDFSFRPEVDGRPGPNRAEPGKRPRSSMAPMIVFGPEDRPVLAIGSPGGSRIIGYVGKVLLGVIDWNLDVQQAISLPNITNRNGPTDLEADSSAVALQEPLERLGHSVRLVPMTSGLHGIQILPSGLLGGADPRREGVVLGD